MSDCKCLKTLIEAIESANQTIWMRNQYSHYDRTQESPTFWELVKTYLEQELNK